MNHAGRLWFERLSLRLGLPVWAGAIIIAILPFMVTYSLISMIYGSWSFFMYELIGFAFVFPTGLYSLFASRYTCLRIEELWKYAVSISRETNRWSLRLLYDFRGVLLALAISNIVFVWSFAAVKSQLYPPVPHLVSDLPWIVWDITTATLLWTWAYSILSLRRMGNLPMRLKHFSQDGTMGLRPFGIVSMRLALTYLGAVTLWAMPNILFLQNLQTLPAFAGLFLLGFAFFLLPLHNLHRKLKAAKRDELSWISLRYRTAMQSFRARGGKPTGQRLLNELLAIGQIRREVQQISTWPFDTGIFLRVTAIVMTAVAIVFARLITLALRL